MNLLGQILLIGLHAFVAWVCLEIYVNNAHRLSRPVYIFFHYLTVLLIFSAVFFIYASFFAAGASAFFITATAMGIIFLIELIVFGFLYSADRWFLNFVDWLFPMFLAASTIYLICSYV